MLHEILDNLGVEPANALMIGDTEYDINMAHNAGMDSVAVSYGVHDKHRLLQCRPKGCLDSIEQLPRWLSQCKVNSGAENSMPEIKLRN
jgi:phosphoglycolate phosphatase